MNGWLRMCGHLAWVLIMVTLLMSSDSAVCITRAKGYRRTTPRLSVGTAKQQIRAKQGLNAAWAQCITTVEEYRRTAPRRFAGIVWQLNWV
jgi:hypothetical protein